MLFSKVLWLVVSVVLTSVVVIWGDTRLRGIGGDGKRPLSSFNTVSSEYSTKIFNNKCGQPGIPQKLSSLHHQGGLRHEGRRLAPPPWAGGGGDGGGGSGGGAPSSCNVEEYDIIIVGGGLAGISAGNEIQRFNYNTGQGLSFKILESGGIGGRAIAAHWLIGENNPLSQKLKEMYSDWHNKCAPDDESSIKYLRNDGTGAYPDPVVQDLEALYDSAYYQALLRELEFENGAIFDESLRDALLGWDPDTPLKRNIEYQKIDFHLASSAPTLGLYNVPDNVLLDLGFPYHPFGQGSSSVAPSGNLYLIGVSGNAAAIASEMASGLPIQENTEVKLIDFDGTKKKESFPVKIRTAEIEPGCDWDFRAERVIVTVSTGVLDYRGDCKYVDGSHDLCDPTDDENDVMFNPVLDGHRMIALRHLYIDEGRLWPGGMSEYRELRFQFPTNFWNTELGSADHRQYINIDTDKPGWCNSWHNLDVPNFYPDSNAIVCTLTTEAFDELAGLEKTLSNDKANELLCDTLSAAFGVDYGCDAHPCNRVNEFAKFPADSVASPCQFSIFDGLNENWYGSYTSWMVARGNKAVHTDFEFDDFSAPERSLGRDLVHFAGTAYCDWHSEYLQGAVYFGTIKGNEVAEELTGVTDTYPDTIARIGEYLGFCFHDAPDPPVWPIGR